MIRSHVLICGGTGCTSSGSMVIRDKLAEELKAKGLEEEVKIVQTGCFGLCALGPIMIIYPEGTFYSMVTPEDIPAEVWESITNGGSLAAAYALYHRKEQLHRERVRALNSKNAELSTGKVGVDTAKEYFTPSEVRSMSRKEVHANYPKILNSMKKWN